MNCSPPGSSVHGIFQTRILEWASISFSRGSFQPRDQTHISFLSCSCRRILTTEPPGKLPPNWSIFLPKDRKRNREREEGGQERRKEKKKRGRKEKIYLFVHWFLNNISSASFYISTHVSFPSLLDFLSSIHSCIQVSAKPLLTVWLKLFCQLSDPILDSLTDFFDSYF